jgi:hypothetical protein
MIPRTFPSIIEAFQTKMVVYVLPSISGLKAWIDYIPVKGVVTESATLANTYANGGYQVVKSLESLTGLQAWIGYIPVYEDASYNKPWSTDAGGYIPVGGLFTPASFFANGEQGWWYDPSNFSTLFQDSAGTTPVTAVEQPVGLQLDLSQGLVLGPELVTNGSGDSTTNWIPTSATIASVGGELELTSTVSGTFQVNYQISTTAGKLYKLTTTARRGTCPQPVNFGFNGVGSTSTNSTGNTSLTVYLFSNGATINVQFFSTGASVGSTFYFDNISVKELPGNHRFQSTSANRPVVSARVNLLTKTEQFDSTDWTKNALTVVADSTVAPNGTTTADTLQANGVSSQHYVNQTAVPNATSCVFSVYAKVGTASFLNIQITGANLYAQWDLSTGTLVFSGAGTGVLTSTSQTNEGNGWYRLVVTFTQSSGSTQSVRVHVLDAAVNSPNPSTTAAGNIFIWGADLRPTNQGVGLPAYQRVNTSTDYDSTGFPVYIKPNGSNQFMQTNSIDFSATDKMTVWQGVRKLSDAAVAMIYEFSASVDANNGSFNLFNNTDGKYTADSKGTLRARVTSLTQNAPITSVIACIASISTDINSIKLNGGTSQDNAADQGTGNYGTYPAYFYARAGTSLFFNGNDYGSIARGAASTAAQITNGEAYINSKTKAFTP